jgi:hypothetical protein
MEPPPGNHGPIHQKTANREHDQRECAPERRRTGRRIASLRRDRRKRFPSRADRRMVAVTAAIWADRTREEHPLAAAWTTFGHRRLGNGERFGGGECRSHRGGTPGRPAEPVPPDEFVASRPYRTVHGRNVAPRRPAGKRNPQAWAGLSDDAIGEHTRPRVSSLAPSPKTVGCGRERRTENVSGGGAGNSTRGRVRSPPLARLLRMPSPSRRGTSREAREYGAAATGAQRAVTHRQMRMSVFTGGSDETARPGHATWRSTSSRRFSMMNSWRSGVFLPM